MYKKKRQTVVQLLVKSNNIIQQRHENLSTQLGTQSLRGRDIVWKRSIIYLKY